MLLLADFLSLIPLYYIITIILITFYYLITQSIHKYYFLVYVIGMAISIILPEMTKRLIGFFKISKKYLYRPYGAKGCNFHSSNGLLPKNTPGFPSGHMTLTTFIIVYFILMIIQKKYSNIKKGVLIFICLSVIISMGWARHVKLCHNLIQIVCGTILGACISIITFKINYPKNIL